MHCHTTDFVRYFAVTTASSSKAIVGQPIYAGIQAQREDQLTMSSSGRRRAFVKGMSHSELGLRLRPRPSRAATQLNWLSGLALDCAN